jgi:hypothetical protein
MKYSELSKTRKAVVDAFVAEYPTIKLSRCITFKQLQTLWVEKLHPAKQRGESKIGYPLWITIEEKFKTEHRGVYYVPVDDSGQEPMLPVKEAKAKKEKQPKALKSKPQLVKIVEEKPDALSEDDFNKILADAGITF